MKGTGIGGAVGLGGLFGLAIGSLFGPVGSTLGVVIGCAIAGGALIAYYLKKDFSDSEKSVDNIGTTYGTVSEITKSQGSTNQKDTKLSCTSNESKENISIFGGVSSLLKKLTGIFDKNEKVDNQSTVENSINFNIKN